MRVDRSYRRDLPLHLDHLHQECKGVETSGEAGERMTVDLTGFARSETRDIKDILRINSYERHI